MRGARIDLDSGGHHWLRLSGLLGAYRVTLDHTRTDRRSVLHEALRRHLLFEVERTRPTLAEAPGSCAVETISFPEGNDSITLPAHAVGLGIRLGRECPFRLASFAFDDAAGVLPVGSRYVLSPFETRYLADNGRPHPVARGGLSTRFGPTTDLHSHFAGCVGAADLLAIAAQHAVRYPTSLLGEAGIRFEGAADVSVADLADELRNVLEGRLAIPIHRPATFLDLERIYRYRSPITKSRKVLGSLCERIAFDYRDMGVRYVELSLANVLDGDCLRDLCRVLPTLERQSGVTIRFLAALSRHDDLEWDLDCIDRMAQLVKCRYLVGVDFMGHETNSTRDFSRQIRSIATWAHRERPGFVIRVHAGENAAYPENVRVAVESTAGCDVAVRIGHGLHGVDMRTLDVLATRGAIVEFNLNSNYALNNLRNAIDAPIRSYIDHGVELVLGTDGYGIYQTTPLLEAQAARLCGLGEADFARIAAVETKYIAMRQKADLDATTDPSEYEVPDPGPARHFTPQVVERRREAAARRDAALSARLATLGIPLLSVDRVASTFRGYRCICFAGAWAHSFGAISPDQLAIVKKEIGRLLASLASLASLAPSRTLLVTGGTRHGIENLVQELARPHGFAVLGALVRETPPEALEPGAFTHACLVGERLYDKAAGLYRLIRDLGGLCLFIGGGPIVSDEIQTAVNLRIQYLLMDGPEGASTCHAREKPDRAFRTADDVLRVIAAETSSVAPVDPYWHRGENPTVDVVVTRHNPLHGTMEILLIRRDEDAPAEPGKWALPGGFVRTEAPRGAPWRPGVETEREGAIRELREETGLDLTRQASSLVHVGDYVGGGRDPRDTPEAWSRSTAFALHLDASHAAVGIAGHDDASEAVWVDLERLPRIALAFDHARIVSDALAHLFDMERTCGRGNAGSLAADPIGEPHSE